MPTDVPCTALSTPKMKCSTVVGKGSLHAFGTWNLYCHPRGNLNELGVV